MKYKLMALLITFFSSFFFFPVSSEALVIGIPINSKFDAFTYYSMGMCRDKFTGNIGDLYTWNEFSRLKKNSVTLGRDEPVCVVTHGATNSAGGKDGREVARLLNDKISNPANVSYLLMMSCYSAVSDKISGSLISNMYLELKDADANRWQGTYIYGGSGICIANKKGGSPFFMKVLQNPLPSGLCEFDKLVAKQDALKITHKVSTALSNCQKGRAKDSAIADCIYNDINVGKFYKDFLTHISDNQCHNDKGIIRKQVP